MKQNYSFRTFSMIMAFVLCCMLITNQAQAQCSGTFYFYENFANNNAGWTLGTEWGIGSATASTCGGGSDPATDHTPTADNGVAGVVIGGCAATTSIHGYYYLTSPVMNTASASGTLELKFWRWLNSDYTPYMQNSVEVYDGTVWVTVWSSGASPGIADNSWTQFTYDITPYKNANMQVRFGFQIGSLGVFTRSSWNIDDVEVTSGVYFEEDFADNAAGWTLGTEWAIGAATASTCGGGSDPAIDHTPTADNGVAGVVIGGCAATSSLHGYYYLTSPVVDLSSVGGSVELKFWRWLNSDYTPYMQNSVEVYNGTAWVTVWSSGASPGIADNSWNRFTYDITAHKSANTQVRFGFQIGSLGAFTRSSWNIDDVTIQAAPSTYSAPTLAVSPTTVCSGSTTQLTGTAMSATDNISWYDAPFSGTLLGSSLSTANFAVNPTDTTIYYAQVNNCGEPRIPITVFVDTLPTVTANPDQVQACNGDAVTLTGGGANTYAWSGGITDNVSFTPTASTVYTVTGTDGNGCANTATADVVVGGAAQTVHFSDDFETGSLSPLWTAGTAAPVTSVITTGSAQGTYNLEYTSASTQHYQGLNGTFTPTQVTEVSWWVKTSNLNNNGYVVLRDAATNNTGIVWSYFRISSNSLAFIGASSVSYDYPTTAINTWYHVELKNWNWTAQTYDIYINNVLVQAAFSFRNPATDMGRIHLYNYSAGVSNYDDIQILSGPQPKLSNATASNAASVAGTGAGTQTQVAMASMNYYNTTCDLIATLDNNATALGSTQADVTVDAVVPTHNGQPYTARWYQITPTNTGVGADVTLYFTQDDFDNYNLAAGTTWPLLPANPTDAAGIANVMVTKNDNTGLGNNPVVIPPTSVTWNATENHWEVLFTTPSFSQFRVHGMNANSTPLPVVYKNFTVRKEATTDVVDWTTANERNSQYFNVQRSLDGQSFETLGTVNSQSLNGYSGTELSYSFVDTDPQLGHNYYRLEQVDIDNKKSLSKVIDIIWGAEGSTVSIYPNPTKDLINIDLSTKNASQVEIKILDMSGRIVKSTIANTINGLNHMTINLNDIAAGVYGVQVYENNKLTHVQKIRKND